MTPEQLRRTREAGRGCSEQLAHYGALRVVGSTRRVAIGRRSFSIGTAAGNDLVLADPYVSARHCQLLARGGELWIEDRGSRNGTWVNDVRVERCGLTPSARIEVGRTRLQLVGERSSGNPGGIVGEHPAMRRVYELIERYGAAEFPVVIVGETGTGKELVARALHEARRGPFEAVNCAAIPNELAESQLFGHTRGAFTGAVEHCRGAFQRADGGTLFLDEVGEMPLAVQPKLLRALEERAVRPVGGGETRPLDVRVVAATHRDLQLETRQGRFRRDLYYRLAVGVIALPPLRERASDIRALVEHFLAREGGQQLSPAALALLERQPWPGNVRALHHALQRAVTLSGARTLQAADFSFVGAAIAAPSVGTVSFAGRPFADVRQEIYRRVLAEHDGNRAAAALALGIPKSTFYDHLRELGL